jgi:hypothetical protein
MDIFQKSPGFVVLLLRHIVRAHLLLEVGEAKVTVIYQYFAEVVVRG